MKVIITDLDLLSQLLQKGFLSLIGDGTLRIYAMLSALPASQHSDAKSAAAQKVVTLVELDEDPYETLWLANQDNNAVSMNQMYVIRYAMNNNMTVLCNDKVFLSVAEGFGVRAYDIDSFSLQPKSVRVKLTTIQICNLL